MRILRLRDAICRLLPFWTVAALGMACGFLPALQSRAAVSRGFLPGLGHVNVVVNGEKSAVQAGQSLHVYRGDNVVFVQAESRDPGVKPGTLAIAVEGFASQGGLAGESSGSAGADFGPDHRGIDINTVNLAGKSFKVAVRAGARAIGQIKLVVMDPRFDYAVVLVNGHPVTVRPGGKVKLRPEDTIKVESVRSNIPDPSKVEVEAPGGGALRFKYRGRVFGEIQLPVRL